MSKTTIDAPRTNLFKISPKELVIIGLDTDDTDAHPLYDYRIKLALEDETTAHMKEHGVLVPVLAYKDDAGKLVVVDGRQRVRHARAAKLEDVPVKVVKGEQPDLFLLARAANAHRAQDTPLDNAKNAQRALDLGKTETEVAQAFGVGPKTVKDWLYLLDLAPAVRKAVDKGDISAAAAAKLRSVDKDKQEDALGKLLSGGGKASATKATKAAADAGGKKAKLTPKDRVAKALDLVLGYYEEIREDKHATSDETRKLLDKVAKALGDKPCAKLIDEQAAADGDAE